MNRSARLPLILSFILTFIIVYFYFLRVRVGTPYGDDLSMFKLHAELKGFLERVNISVPFGKYRPVHGLMLDAVVNCFHKHVAYYYVFNAFIQAVNTFIFALILDLFLNSYILSFLFSLTFGLSRFFFYNMTQLLAGGVLEGLALTFFLATVLFVIKAMIQHPDAPNTRWKDLLWALLFANLSMYTHERYVVLFLFIIFIAAIYPNIRLSVRQRAAIGGLAIASVALNVLIKKMAFGLPFFVGTGGTNIEFSFSTAFSFFCDAILSILQINSGPDYLIGIPYSGLPDAMRPLALLAALGLVALIFIFLYKVTLVVFRHYLSRTVKAEALKEAGDPTEVYLAVFLSVLFLLCLVPAIVTIRLEQRWLTASFSLFILVAVIVLNRVRYRSTAIKYISFSLFMAVILLVNEQYLSIGMDRLYMSNAEKIAASYKEAEQKNIIHPNATKLYIWENTRNPNSENEIFWSIDGGYIFEFYDARAKEMAFVDSLYQKTDNSYSFKGFDTNTSQIIYLSPELKDITGEYLKDSLKTFTSQLKK